MVCDGTNSIRVARTHVGLHGVNTLWSNLPFLVLFLYLHVSLVSAVSALNLQCSRFQAEVFISCIHVVKILSSWWSYDLKVLARTIFLVWRIRS